jgi:hypothetical protein
MQDTAVVADSQPLQNEIECDSGVNGSRVSVQRYGPNQFAAQYERVSVIVVIRVAFKDGISREIKLRYKRLVPGACNQIVDVLAYASWVVPGHNGLNAVRTVRGCCQLSPESITIKIVPAVMIGLPNLDCGARYLWTRGAENDAANRERQAGICSGSQLSLVRRQPLVEWTDLIPLSRLSCRALLCLDSGNDIAQNQPGGQLQRSSGRAPE